MIDITTQSDIESQLLLFNTEIENFDTGIQSLLELHAIAQKLFVLLRKKIIKNKILINKILIGTSNFQITIRINKSVNIWITCGKIQMTNQISGWSIFKTSNGLSKPTSKIIELLLQENEEEDSI